MNIKKILLVMSALAYGSSFSAHALLKVTSGEFAGEVYASASAFGANKKGQCVYRGASRGTYIDVKYGRIQHGKVQLLGSEYRNSQCTALYNSGYHFVIYSYTTVAECPEGQELNAAGQCETPPTPYCETDEAAAVIAQMQADCFALGNNNFVAQCNDDTQEISSQCTYDPGENPEVPKPGCDINSAGWPQCLPWYDNDPTPDPIDPIPAPSPDPITPSVPSPVTPPTGNDAGSNTDLINSISNLNEDNNQNFADMRTDLSGVLSKSQVSNDLLLDQIQNDIDIYNNQKAETQDLKNSMVKAISAIPDRDHTDEASINRAIGIAGDKTVDAVDKTTEAINQLSEKLPEQCVPTSDNNYCENPHGLTEGTISDMFGQINGQMDKQIVAADSTIMSAVSDVIAQPPVEESTVEPFLDKGISLLTRHDNCVPLDFFGHELSCEFSDRFKQIFGFLLYIWTLWTLTDILLTGITPNATPYLRRRS